MDDKMKRFGDLARVAHERAQASLGTKDVDGAWCSRCSNSGIEIYIDADGYKVARRCDHNVTIEPIR